MRLQRCTISRFYSWSTEISFAVKEKKQKREKVQKKKGKRTTPKPTPSIVVARLMYRAVRATPSIGCCYWRWVAIYPPADRIWFCSFRCPRSPRGRPRNRRNRQGHRGPRPCRWYFATDRCRVSSGWPVWRASDDYYWRWPTAAAASTAESLEGDAEGTGPRAPVPRLSPPCLEDRKRETRSCD